MRMRGVRTVTRYVVTHLDANGVRTLAHPAQGRHTYEHAYQAQAWIDAAMANNSAATITGLYGLPLEVRPVPCYPGHFDPVTCYPDHVTYED